MTPRLAHPTTTARPPQRHWRGKAPPLLEAQQHSNTATSTSIRAEGQAAFMISGSSPSLSNVEYVDRCTRWKGRVVTRASLKRGQIDGLVSRKTRRCEVASSVVILPYKFGCHSTRLKRWLDPCPLVGRQLKVRTELPFGVNPSARTPLNAQCVLGLGRSFEHQLPPLAPDLHREKSLGYSLL